ncbi:MAG TPA: hypothetical protein VIJ00_16795 [Nakamurella sp.]
MPLPTAASVAVLRAALARRAEPDRPARAPQLWLDYRGRPLSPNAVGKAFTVLVKRFIASPVGVELEAPEITLHGTRHTSPSTAGRRACRPRRRARLLGHTSEVFSQVTYGHLTDDEGNTLPVLYDRVAA